LSRGLQTPMTVTFKLSEEHSINKSTINQSRTPDNGRAKKSVPLYVAALEDSEFMTEFIKTAQEYESFKDKINAQTIDVIFLNF
jgi:hypothetical protein